jgi:hypothetical protein
VYNSDLVRQLCGEISAEVDPQRALDLISLLRAIIQEDQEEIRTRMAFLARSYPIVISDTNAAD